MPSIAISTELRNQETSRAPSCLPCYRCLRPPFYFFLPFRLRLPRLLLHGMPTGILIQHPRLLVSTGAITTRCTMPSSRWTFFRVQTWVGTLTNSQSDYDECSVIKRARCFVAFSIRVRRAYKRKNDRFACTFDR